MPRFRSCESRRMPCSWRIFHQGCCRSLSSILVLGLVILCKQTQISQFIPHVLELNTFIPCTLYSHVGLSPLMKSESNCQLLATCYIAAGLTASMPVADKLHRKLMDVIQVNDARRFNIRQTHKTQGKESPSPFLAGHLAGPPA